MTNEASRSKLLFVAVVAVILSAAHLLASMLEFATLGGGLYVRVLTVAFPIVALGLSSTALADARHRRVERGAAVMAAWVVVMLADWYLPVSRDFLGM